MRVFFSTYYFHELFEFVFVNFYNTFDEMFHDIVYQKLQWLFLGVKTIPEIVRHLISLN